MLSYLRRLLKHNYTLNQESLERTVPKQNPDLTEQILSGTLFENNPDLPVLLQNRNMVAHIRGEDCLEKCAEAVYMLKDLSKK